MTKSPKSKPARKAMTEEERDAKIAALRREARAERMNANLSAMSGILAAGSQLSGPMAVAAAVLAVLSLF